MTTILPLKSAAILGGWSRGSPGIWPIPLTCKSHSPLSYIIHFSMKATNNFVWFFTSIKWPWKIFCISYLFFVHCSLLRPTRKKKNCTYTIAILTAACGCTCSCCFEILFSQCFRFNCLFSICWSISSHIFWAILPSVLVHFQMCSSRKYPFLPDRRNFFFESPFPLWILIVLHKFCWSF